MCLNYISFYYRLSIVLKNIKKSNIIINIWNVYEKYCIITWCPLIAEKIIPEWADERQVRERTKRYTEFRIHKFTRKLSSLSSNPVMFATSWEHCCTYTVTKFHNFIMVRGVSSKTLCRCNKAVYHRWDSQKNTNATSVTWNKATYVLSFARLLWIQLTILFIFFLFRFASYSSIHDFVRTKIKWLSLSEKICLYSFISRTHCRIN